MEEPVDFIPEGTEPIFTEQYPALCFHLHAKEKRARASTVHLPHGPVFTPIFMPVGTKATIKGLHSKQLVSITFFLVFFLCIFSSCIFLFFLSSLMKL